MMAGLFISFGSFVAFTLGAYINSGFPAFTKAAQAFAFAAALSLVVMAGAELFTGNNFVLGAAVLRKKLSWQEAARLWGSNPVRAPNFRPSPSEPFQLDAFATGGPPRITEFHLYPGSTSNLSRSQV